VPDHRYHQYCALARALDVAGDRWTLLIVRELLPGARRFTDLIEGLPGISRKVLTERVRDLERDGVIARRELPPPAARQVYELTGDGRDLASAMTPLIGWGASRLGQRASGDSFRPRWAAIGMWSLADREAAVGVHETYQYFVGDSAFHFIVDDGSIELHDGRAENPTVVLTTDEKTFVGMLSGKLTDSAAIKGGAVAIAGDRRAAKRLGQIFGQNQIFTQARTVATGGPV
jgi:DNA-binding HxlR family transcriptional regulator/putative sterol carrier protein